MPILKFRCKNCGQVFDKLVQLSAKDSVVCDKCGGETERAYEGKYYGMCSSSGHGDGCDCSSCHGGHCDSCH